MLEGQGVTCVIDHRERGVRVVVYEVYGGRVPTVESSRPGRDQRRTRVRRPVIAGEFAALAEVRERAFGDPDTTRDDRPRDARVFLIQLDARRRVVS